MRRHLTPLLTAATAILLLAAACSSGSGVDGTERPSGIDGDLELIAALQPVDDCDQLLADLQAEALDRVGPYGFDDGRYYFGIAEDGLAVPGTAATSAEGDDDAAASDAAAAPQTPVTTTPGVSGTNVQEAGVDEPDVVKADGERILAVAGGELHWIDVTGDTPVDAGSVELPGDGYGQQLLVAGDTALVLVSGYGGPMPIEGDVAVDSSSYLPGEVPTSIVQVDLSGPDSMAVTATLEVDGTLLDARLVGETARVVVSSAPDQLGFVYPSTGSEEAERIAEEANRRVVEESDLEDWLPSYRLVADTEGTDESVVDEGTLVACDRMNEPAAFAGFGTLSVLTFDVADDLGTGDAVGVLADGEQVYANAEHLYVATTQYEDQYEESDDPTTTTVPETAVLPPLGGPDTAIHRFSITGDGPAEYQASGLVRGRLLDQFSMSETPATDGGDDDAVLRVATTDDDESESYVTTLRADDDELVELGQVGGLGEDEQIYSVRFVGDVGYVVTFRQTDPLYTVDLSDPAAPAVVGELELLGYSAYLHPIGEDLLLGVGQDATATGQTTGTQLSLFDVSDPAAPTRLQQVAIPGASSAAEYDHHAFLYWPETGLAVLPVQSYGGDVVCSGPAGEPVPCGGPSASFNGAVGFHVATDGIDEVGRVTHEDGSALARSVVVGDTLYTLSDTSLVASDLATLAPQTTIDLG